MTDDPILLIGGTGHIGSQAARLLRKAHPEQKLLIGVRDPARASDFAAKLGNAEAVAIDLSQADLGLGVRPVAAVAIFLKDNHVNAIRFAQRRRIGFVSISTVAIEMVTEVAAWIRRPSFPLVLGSQWLAGSGVLATLHFAQAYEKLDSITLSAVIDPTDMGGSAAMADSERLGPVMRGALVRESGAYAWLTGERLSQPVTCADGSRTKGSVYGTFDAPSLSEITGAANVKLVFAVAETARTKAGGAPSSEIIIDLSGVDRQGIHRRSRHALISADGQAPVTGLGVALVLERLTGLDGRAPAADGLYFVDNLIDHQRFVARARAEGIALVDLPNEAE
jgi:hypothetical protein